MHVAAANVPATPSTATLKVFDAPQVAGAMWEVMRATRLLVEGIVLAATG